MARHSGTKKRQKLNGDQKINHYETTVYSSIPESDGDIYIITQDGDRLDLLANTYYNDSSLWWYIAKANNLKVMNIPIGTSLRIPGSINYATGR
tara:strand:- start:364 stop:645 length:282 start_codon:yes stop_codon:yes gene_type:complete